MFHLFLFVSSRRNGMLLPRVGFGLGTHAARAPPSLRPVPTADLTSRSQHCFPPSAGLGISGRQVRQPVLIDHAGPEVEMSFPSWHDSPLRNWWARKQHITPFPQLLRRASGGFWVLLSPWAPGGNYLGGLGFSVVVVKVMAAPLRASCTRANLTLWGRRLLRGFAVEVQRT